MLSIAAAPLSKYGNLFIHYLRWWTRLPLRFTFLYAAIQCFILLTCYNLPYNNVSKLIVLISWLIYCCMNACYWKSFVILYDKIALYFPFLKRYSGSELLNESRRLLMKDGKNDTNKHQAFFKRVVALFSRDGSGKPWKKNYIPYYHPLHTRACNTCNNISIETRNDKSIIAENYKKLNNDIIVDHNTRHSFIGFKETKEYCDNFNHTLRKLDEIENRSSMIGSRMRHCKDCDECRFVHSHHCEFVGECISEPNYIMYFNFIFCSMMFMMFIDFHLIYLTVQSFTNYYHQSEFLITFSNFSSYIPSSIYVKNGNIFQYASLMALMIQVCACSIYLYILSSLFNEHLNFICNNVTAAEEKKYRYLGFFKNGGNVGKYHWMPYNFKRLYGKWMGTFYNMRWRLFTFDNQNQYNNLIKLKSEAYEHRVASLLRGENGIIAIIDTIASYYIPLYYVFSSRQNVAKRAYRSDLSLYKYILLPDLDTWQENVVHAHFNSLNIKVSEKKLIC